MMDDDEDDTEDGMVDDTMDDDGTEVMIEMVNEGDGYGLTLAAMPYCGVFAGSIKPVSCHTLCLH